MIQWRTWTSQRVMLLFPGFEICVFWWTVQAREEVQEKEWRRNCRSQASDTRINSRSACQKEERQVGFCIFMEVESNSITFVKQLTGACTQVLHAHLRVSMFLRQNPFSVENMPRRAAKPALDVLLCHARSPASWDPDIHSTAERDVLEYWWSACTWRPARPSLTIKRTIKIAMCTHRGGICMPINMAFLCRRITKISHHYIPSHYYRYIGMWIYSRDIFLRLCHALAMLACTMQAVPARKKWWLQHVK